MKFSFQTLVLAVLVSIAHVGVWQLLKQSSNPSETPIQTIQMAMSFDPVLPETQQGQVSSVDEPEAQVLEILAEPDSVVAKPRIVMPPEATNAALSLEEVEVPTKFLDLEKEVALVGVEKDLRMFSGRAAVASSHASEMTNGEDPAAASGLAEIPEPEEYSALQTSEVDEEESEKEADEAPTKTIGGIRLREIRPLSRL